MNDSEKLLNEIKDIRKIMERSSRFLTLSGLSGILVGIYALAGAIIVYLIASTSNDFFIKTNSFSDKKISIIVVAISVLILSIFTIFLLTLKKARKEQKPIWGPGSKLLLFNLIIPLATGGILVAILVFHEYYVIISAALLIFYGLALVNAAKYTRPEILGLGIFEIILGLLAAAITSYGIYFWALGFGILHIVYGLMFLREERKNPVA